MACIFIANLVSSIPKTCLPLVYSPFILFYFLKTLCKDRERNKIQVSLCVCCVKVLDLRSGSVAECASCSNTGSHCVLLSCEGTHTTVRHASPPVYCRRSITQSMCACSSSSPAQTHPGSPHPAFNVNLTFTDT